MDQGVILSMKNHYSRLLAERIVGQTKERIAEDARNNTVSHLSEFKINQYVKFADAVKFAIKSWQRVTKDTIQNSWRRVGFSSLFTTMNWLTDLNMTQDSVVDIEDQLLLQDLQNIQLCNNDVTVHSLQEDWSTCDIYPVATDAMEYAKLTIAAKKQKKQLKQLVKQ